MLYRCRPGFTHGAKDEVQPGDTIELTDREASGLLDKFELVVEEPKKPKKPKAPAGEQVDGQATA